jgi:phosphohistidine swiveling domain-containing protein
LAPSGDAVLEDARRAVESRDDHAGVSCMWPLGLVRRALLTAGNRLYALGLLDERELVLDAGTAEVVALLRADAGAPTSDDLAARRDVRRRMASVEPPAVLGERHPPPDPALFPRGLREISEAMAAFLAAMESDASRDRATGIGVGTAAYRGRAVVAQHPEDAIDRVRDGDVLVTATTTPAFNCVLPVAGALVTAYGGLMSHAGIAARELDIPAVIGLADALERIPDGAQVEVDPVAGCVRVLA